MKSAWLARLNTDKRQINETAYDPESKVERSVRTVKETGSRKAPTIAGRRRSRPTFLPIRPAPRQGEQTKKQNERKEDLTNYEITTKTTSTVNEGYKIENMTVAVVVNRKRLLASAGDPVSAEAIDKQLKQVEQLVESAAGADQKRGDRVTVAAVDFFQDGKLLEPLGAGGLLDHVDGLISAVS